MAISATQHRGQLWQRTTVPGIAGRVMHVRLRAAPVTPARVPRGSAPQSALASADVATDARFDRLGANVRRAYALLIAAAVSVVLYRALDPRLAISGAPQGIDVLWVAPALAGGAAVGAGLVVASASRPGCRRSSDWAFPRPAR